MAIHHLQGLPEHSETLPSRLLVCNAQPMNKGGIHKLHRILYRNIFAPSQGPAQREYPP